MKRTIAILVLILVFALASCGAPTSSQNAPDAPGAWIPHPIGSGWCMATGIPGTPNGTIAHCPTPPSK